MLHPVFGQIAIATQNLNTQISNPRSRIGTKDLAHRGQKGRQIGVLEQRGSTIAHGAGAQGQGVHFSEHARHITMSGNHPAALSTLVRIGAGQSMRLRSMGHPLHGHIKPGMVHHHEHRLEPVSRLTEQLGIGTRKAQLAGRGGVQPELFFNPHHFDTVAGPIAALRVAGKQRQPLHAFGWRAGTRQHQMHNGVAEVLIAAGNEDFFAAQRPLSSLIPGAAGADRPQIGAGIGLGQAHRCQRRARGEFGDKSVLLGLGAKAFDDPDGTGHQAHQHLKGVIGPGQQFGSRTAYRGWRANAADRDRKRQQMPAQIDIAFISLGQGGGYAHAPINNAATGAICRSIARRNLGIDEFLIRQQHAFGGCGIPVRGGTQPTRGGQRQNNIRNSVHRALASQIVI